MWSCFTLTRSVFHMCMLIDINYLKDIIYSSYHCHHLHLQVSVHQGDLQPWSNLHAFILIPKKQPLYADVGIGGLKWEWKKGDFSQLSCVRCSHGCFRGRGYDLLTLRMISTRNAEPWWHVCPPPSFSWPPGLAASCRDKAHLSRMVS